MLYRLPVLGRTVPVRHGLTVVLLQIRQMTQSELLVVLLSVLAQGGILRVRTEPYLLRRRLLIQRTRTIRHQITRYISLDRTQHSLLGDTTLQGKIPLR